MMDTDKLFNDIVESINLKSISTLVVVTVALEVLTLLETNHFYLKEEEFD